MNQEEIIYFEVDNWFCGRDYPNEEPFLTWMKDDMNLTLKNDDWAKENKLCIMAGPIDMSICFCVAAPRSWVEATCPKLLTDEIMQYETITSHYSGKLGKWIDKHEKHYKKYSDFRCYPDKYGDVCGHISGWRFPEYREDNYGVEWNNSWWEDDDDDDKEDEEF